MATSTISVQQVLDYARAYPDVSPTIPGVAGYSLSPALRWCDIVMREILQSDLNWKFNRNVIPAFLTVPLQQDYVTNVTDLAWTESGQAIDINNTSQPKTMWQVRSVRDLPNTWIQFDARSQAFTWIPNNQAQTWTWTASTVIPCGYGIASIPSSPIQQFYDANNNLLFLNSAALNLSINSAGVTGSGSAYGSPYGTTGLTAPLLAANSAAGTTVIDGSVVWTVASPNGFAIRFNPIPPLGGICYLYRIWYQMKPPLFTSAEQVLTPIPDEMYDVFLDGFIAMCRAQSPDPAAREKYKDSFVQWKMAIRAKMASFDREASEIQVMPTVGFGGRGGDGGGYGPAPWPSGAVSPGSPAGAGNPFNY